MICHVLSPVLSQLGYGTGTAAASKCTARVLLSPAPGDGDIVPVCRRPASGSPAADRMPGRGFRTVTPVFPPCELASVHALPLDLTQGGRYHAAITTGPEDAVTAEPAADLPIATLRGAGVDGNPRRAALALMIIVFVAVLAAAAILFAAGAQKNAQINDLRQHGVRVSVTVTGCHGLLGGSGSNAAGEACRGSYAFGGRRYDEALPGSVRRTPGATVRGVVAADDPTLLTTAAILRTEHPSWWAYLTPSVLLLADLALALVVLGVQRRSALSGGPWGRPGSGRWRVALVRLGAGQRGGARDTPVPAALLTAWWARYARTSSHAPAARKGTPKPQ